MGRQTGTIKITGTKGNITFYRMNGKYYARKKSSLTGKRVKKDPAFKLTMMYAGWLKKASKIAAAVYQLLNEEEREHSQYRTMTGIAMKMLKAGVEPDVIADHLLEQYMPPVLYVTEEGRLVNRTKKAAPVFRDSLVLHNRKKLRISYSTHLHRHARWHSQYL